MVARTGLLDLNPTTAPSGFESLRVEIERKRIWRIPMAAERAERINDPGFQ